jgi:flagellar biosynthesis anti-sigma factor FlgM
MVQPIRPQDATGIYQRQVAQTDAAEAAARRNGTAGAASGRRTDQVSLSENAHAFARIMRGVLEQPDVRAQRVEALRARIEQGTYDVDALLIARRLYDRGIAS